MKAFFFAAAVFALAVCAGMYVTRPRETASVLPLDLTRAASVQSDASDAQISAPEEQEAAPDDAEPSVVFPQNVTLGTKECAALVRKKMLESAAYVPEISTTGENVAPADLPDENASAFDDAVVPVIVKLRRAYDSGREPVRALPVLTVRLKDGKVYLNDTPVPPDDLEILRAACGSAAH